MIHFNFIVSDAEAEEIMDGVHEKIMQCHAGLLECIGDEDKTKWYRNRMKFLEELQAKMLNTRV